MFNTGEIVQSVGNSWVICRSKTYGGRIYYFNTATAEATWDLNETEVEKAKKRTKLLQKEAGFTIENCPEPLGSPQVQSMLENQLPLYKCNNIRNPQQVLQPNVYNKQIINNQYTKVPNIYSNQLLQCNPMNTLQLISPGYNPTLFNVTPQQVFLTPTVRQPQPMTSDAYTNFDLVPITTTTETLSSRFKKNSELPNSSSVCTPVSNNNHEYKKVSKQFKGKLKKYKNMDLRLLLSMKRGETLNNTEDLELSGCKDDEEISDKYNDIILHKDTDLFTPQRQGRSYSFNPNEEKDNGNDDSEWLEENMHSHGYTKPLDIKEFRDLLQIPENSDFWYIVTDSNVLLNNVNFLNILLKSDKHCRLMLPKSVMDKIQCATKSRLRTQAHRVAYFVFQMIDAKLANIDQSNEEIDGIEDVINCCIKLIDKGNGVVLITDDIELHNYEIAPNIPIFTIREIKQLVHKRKSNENLTKNVDAKALALASSIKITIDNDTNYKCEEKTIQDNIHMKSPIKNDVATNEENKILNQSLNFNRDLENNTQACEIGVQVDSLLFPKTTDTKISNTVTSKTCHSSYETDAPCNINKKHMKLNINCEKSSRVKNSGKSNFLLNDVRVDDSVASVSAAYDLPTVKNIFPGNNNLPWGLSSSTSIESVIKYDLEHYDGSNETSSTTLQVENTRDNTTLGETSDSSISNTQNFVNKGSKRKILHKVSNVKLESEDTNVMFEIVDQKMEECLKMKSDEWVSRFVQIMEEALTQVLNLEPIFVLNSMPPPWTVHEATECVKRKFRNDSDVDDAATKLLNVSFENGGLRGKIKSDISPSKYMELYSYGVYLIDALQGLLNNNEDLQTAAESLSKLLRDIQEPHLDPSNQDCFTDNLSHEVNFQKENDRELIGPNANEGIPLEISQKNNKNSTTIISPEKFDLSSLQNRKAKGKSKGSGNVAIVRRIDKDSFFSKPSQKEPLTSINTDKVKNVNSVLKSESQDVSKEICTGYQDDAHFSNNFNTGDDQPQIKEPKIIRNFTKCLEIEEKLKNSAQQFRFDSWTHNPEFDVSCLDKELMNNDYYSEDYEIDEDDMCDYEDVSQNLNSASSHISTNQDATAENSTVTFALIMEQLESYIKNALTSVHEFCVKSSESLHSPKLSDEKKNEMQEQAKKTCADMNDICSLLNSILKREKSDKNLFHLLNAKDFGNVVIGEGDIMEYSDFITVCLEQANILRESVELVLKASKE